ncbi:MULTISPECIES: TauD/TfdA family dioxygenase [unclassified Streptomyces]|uniref:TauD/TfdA family dioxygenase n=1 Tax=unclassified Streptomyces TaxID=2593676 RepID=UPI000A4AC9C8|nr:MULTISPECIES: TauD/TfdA family dioxygenase [unclassified Streptomyces]
MTTTTVRTAVRTTAVRAADPSVPAPAPTAVLDWRTAPGKPATAEAPAFADIDEACAWLQERLPELTAALHVHGALYLRGLPVRTVEDFARVRDVLVPERTPYREKATPRSSFGDDVFSSTDLPPSQSIRMHNENSYTLTFPRALLFGCLIAPAEQGATPVADVRKVLANVPPALAEKMRAHGWLLQRSYSDYISTDWKTAFATEDPADVERYCAENRIALDWQEDGNLRTSQVRPGTIRHPDTGEEVWFNHLVFWNEWALDEELRETLVDEFGREGLPFNTAFGDGTPLSREDLDALQEAYDKATVRERWQVGDVMLVDNILTSHGRDPFRGDRKIVVAMGNPADVEDCRPSVRPAARFA